MTGSAGSTLPAAKPPATVVLPRAILGATGVELLHPETGQLLARVPLRERGAAFFQSGDFFYVAHQNSFSLVNLRTEVVREIKLSLSHWRWEQRANLLILRSADGRGIFYDLTDPAVPNFLRFEASDAFFQNARMSDPIGGSKQTRGKGLIIAGSTLVGVGLALPSAVLLTLCVAQKTPQNPEGCLGIGRIGAPLIAGGVGVLGIPGAIMRGVGSYQRSHPLQPAPLPDSVQAAELLKAAKPALIEDRNYASTQDIGLMATGRF